METSSYGKNKCCRDQIEYESASMYGKPTEISSTFCARCGNRLFPDFPFDQTSKILKSQALEIVNELNKFIEEVSKHQTLINGGALNDAIATALIEINSLRTESKAFIIRLRDLYSDEVEL